MPGLLSAQSLALDSSGTWQSRHSAVHAHDSSGPQQSTYESHTNRNGAENLQMPTFLKNFKLIV